jgi:hypothetical protein
LNETGPISHEPLVLSVRLSPYRPRVISAGPVAGLVTVVAIMTSMMFNTGAGVIILSLALLHGLDALRERVAGDEDPPIDTRDAQGTSGGAASRWDLLIGQLSHRGSIRSILTGGRWSWSDMVRAAGDESIDMPRALVDRRLSPAIREIEIPDDLVEREFIAESFSAGNGLVIVVLALVLFLAGRAAIGGDWAGAAIFIVVAAIFAPSIPWVKKYVPMLRAEAQAPIAAPGEVKDHRGRRWCAENAVMLVQPGPAIWSRGGQGLHVCLLGEAGRLELAFQSPRDPDFITLWQRWVHPHPRPDLAVEDPSEGGGG